MQILNDRLNDFGRVVECRREALRQKFGFKDEFKSVRRNNFDVVVDIVRPTATHLLNYIKKSRFHRI